MTSKRRRKEREVLRREYARAERAESAARRTADECRREVGRLMRLIDPGDDLTVWPQDRAGVLPVVIVPVAEAPPWRFDPGLALASMSLRHMRLEAVPMALPLPDGRSVRWFAWRLAGMEPPP